MSLGPGTRLGPYEVVAAIGAGGMGEVYRARDTRLQRDVAIKVLPAAFSSDQDRLTRFEQEARAAAALNHSNILAVFDIGTHEGAPYIVSELLEGETLRETIGGLSVRKAIDYAIQMAHGLAAAHERGIVHRDLKPENIFITTDGRVKILDFGLAKLTHAEPTTFGVSALPTTPIIGQGAPHTLAGVVLGTVGYMAPEQVRGVAADHRADIFAFGAILYEMLSGRRAFHGETTMDTMMAIAKESPPELPSVERHISPALGRIVDRCLEKSPSARFQSTRDLAFALEGVSSSTFVTPSDQEAVRTGRPTVRVAWTTAGVASAAFVIALGVLIYRTPTPVPAPPVKFTVSAPPDVQLLEASTAAPSLSPDGRYLVFRAGRLGSATRALLWIRALDSLDARPLAGTEGGSTPFWAPDSRSVGYVAEGKLFRVEVAGTPPQTICDGAQAGGGTWNNDGTILFAGDTGIRKVSAAGGPSVPVTTLSSGETGHRWPEFLPDGRRFLYLALQAGRADYTSYLTSLESKERTRIGEVDSKVKYSPPGYLLFARGRVLVASAFDVATGRLIGDPQAIAEPISFQSAATGGGGNAALSVSATGALAFRTGDLATAQLQWFERSGKPGAAIGDPGPIRQFNLSRDQKQIALEQIDARLGTSDIWLGDVSRGVFSRFTFDPASETDPTWSPDGTRIAFSRNGGAVIFEKPVGGGPEVQLLALGQSAWPDDWSPDGRFMVYVSPLGGRVIGILPLTGDKKPFALIDSPFRKDQPEFSPDGRWLAYNSDESGRSEVYVQPFPGPGERVRLSTAGGTQPRWRKDGQELFYLALDGTLMSVATGLPSLAPTAPKPLFQTHINVTAILDHYAVSADGQRFLMLVPTGSANETPITVVLNWTSLLNRK